jgi:hypothetical protein
MPVQPQKMKRWGTPLTLVDDHPEIFAFCVKPRSNALGAEYREVGQFEKPVNLHDIDKEFNSRLPFAHSKQFNSNIVDEWNYWKQVHKHFLPEKFKHEQEQQ